MSKHGQVTYGNNKSYSHLNASHAQGYGSAAAYARDAGAYHAASKKAHKGKRVAIAVVAALLVVLVGAGSAFALYINHINDALRGSKSNEELLGIQDALGYSSSLNEPFYMLLLGSDRREGYDVMGARSDTNIVVRVDPTENQLTMVSIPRDTKVEIPGHGTQKFNAAYAFGGAASTIKAAEDLLDIDISHYAEVNFRDLASLVDAVGGVEVEVERKIDDRHCDDGDGNHYVIEAGTQTLNGGQALTFARTRQYVDGDFTRQSHQRQLIQAIIDKVLAMPITSIPGIVDAAAQCVTTDLSVFDIVGLAQQFADQGDLVIYSAMLPSYTQNINGISFVINDEEKTAEMMKAVEEGRDPSGITSTKTASDVNNSKIDTSNVILDDDDEDTATKKVQNSSKPSSSSSSAASAAKPSDGETNSGSDSTSGESTEKPGADASSSPADSGGSGTSTPSGNTPTSPSDPTQPPPNPNMSN